VGIQPARTDHARERHAVAAGLVVLDCVTNGHEAPPIVNNGVMFVATPGNQAIALDAKTGRCCGAIAARCPRT
jgi:hypothetical protein